jgi:hypothetical protein
MGGDQKIGELENASKNFQKSSNQLKKKMWWKNMKVINN